MGRKREEEEWARLVLGKHLGRVAEMHDDGTQDSMCDLRVGTVEAPEIAIECVQDADPDAIRVWKKGPAGGPHQIETKGDWLVELSSSCQVAKLPRRLAPLLAILHSSGLLHMDLESTIQSTASHIARELVELGVTGVECINVNGNGRVHFTMSSPGGIVDPDWGGSSGLGKRIDCQREVCRRATQTERLWSNTTSRVRHSRDSAAASSSALLYHFTFDGCPTANPTVPAEVTGVWLLLPSAGRGLYWDVAGWRAVDASAMPHSAT